MTDDVLLASDKELLNAFNKNSLLVLKAMATDVYIFSSRSRDKLYQRNSALKHEIFKRLESGVWSLAN